MQVTEQALLNLLSAGWRFPGANNLSTRGDEPSADRYGRVERLSHLFAQLYAALPLLTGPRGAFPVATVVSGKNGTLHSLGCRPATGRLVLKHPPPPLQIERRPDWWDSPTYVLRELHIDSDNRVCSVDQTLGTYSETVATADYLELEALAASQHDSPCIDMMPYRKSLLSHSSPRDCLFAGGGIVATIGISVLLVFVRDGVPWALIERRPKRVGPPASMYHVIPAMLHQPTQTRSGALEHITMLDSIYREYLEELFAMPESHVDKPDSSLAQVAAHPSFKYLTSMLGAGNARLQCTGVAFNLLNHRPDVCALLLINEESWFHDEAVRIPLSSWPSASSDQTSRSLTTALPLASPLWLEVLQPGDVSPPGAASIVLGMRRAFELLQQAPPEWLRRFN